MAADHDRNLLFGVFALQADLVDSDQFAQACRHWATNKETPLAEILIAHGWLTAEEQIHVDFLVERTLRKHGGNLRASLCSTASGRARDVLASLGDAELRQCLADLAPPEDRGLSTIAYEPECRERYKLSHLHAKGGIGQVWLARDEVLGREVALKELRPERADDRATGTRFLEEARVTGQLEHPGIVPVYELVRQTDGHAFYTMRFVRGRTLHEAVKDYHRNLSSGTADALALRDLLGAFVAVCNAVAYAHSRGILHRDLKPQNIVLGDFGEVIVLDWGLAKIVGTDRDGATGVGAVGNSSDFSAPSAVTQEGQILGTPAYMSPEQADGRMELVGRHSDVYSLGAVLYEILTGKPPFAGKDTPELLRRVVREIPQPPRQLVASTPRTLEAICLKALAKRPEARFTSAKALAQDVECFLADEPVTAFAEPLGLRASRWMRRHQTALAGTAALLFTAVVALAIGAYLIKVQRDEKEIARGQALANEADAQSQRVRAESNYQKARQAVERMLTRVGEERLRNVPQLEHLRRDLLKDALEFNRELLGQKAEDPDSRYEAVQSWFRVGRIQQLLGAHKEAELAYGSAREILRALAAEFPATPLYRAGIGNVNNNLGIIFASTDRVREAEEAYSESNAVYEKLCSELPQIEEYRRSLAQGQVNWGVLLARNPERAAEAEAVLRKSLLNHERLVDDAPANSNYRSGLGAALHSLASFQRDRGFAEEAQQLLLRAIAQQELALRASPQEEQYRRFLANHHEALGLALQRFRPLAEVESAYLRAVSIRERLCSDFPGGYDYWSELGAGLGNLAFVLRKQSRLNEARDRLRRAIDCQQKALEGNAQNQVYRDRLRRHYRGLGETLVLSGKHVEAARTANELVEVFPTDAADAYFAASFLARCGPLAARDAELAEQERKLLTSSYPEQAVRMLETAIKNGYRDVTRMRTDEDLNSLRSRPDFQKALADLQRRAAAGNAKGR